jgi:hypothetical protein
MRRRRLIAAWVGTAVAAGVLAGADARAAPATTLTYPDGAAGTWFRGKAFDACSAPSQVTLRKWLSSPYRAVGIYMSGPHRACSQARLTSSWVTEVSAMGWKILPLDVGLQAPCAANKRLTPMSRKPSSAKAQGAEAGRRAVRAATRLGFQPGSALYSDLEPFYASRDAECTRAVRSYVTGWTQTLHASGYLSGVYGSHFYGVQALAAGYDSTSYARPDAIWTARWNLKANTTGWTGVPDSRWAVHQRVKQYRGDHDETHGGIRINIDSNIVDGPVATVALPYRVTAGEQVTGRDRPGILGQARSAFRAGTVVRVVCQARTTAGTWDKLTDGTFLPDSAIADGAPKPTLPSCATPFQIAGGAAARQAPGVHAAQSGTAPGGALAWITCQTPGTVLGRTGYWQRLEDGTWISGGLLAALDAASPTTGVPLCPS